MQKKKKYNGDYIYTLYILCLLCSNEIVRVF